MEVPSESDRDRTTIYRPRSSGEAPVGYVTCHEIFRLRLQEGLRIGRCERDGDVWRVLRSTRFGEKELGTVDSDRQVRSHGLFEGGELGWLEADGTVMRGGLIFEEEEVGRVEGPHAEAAAAALLLIFVPEEEETDREMKRRE